MSKEQIVQLEIGRINRTGGTQMRAALNQETVETYAERMKAGDDFPPIEVMYDGTVYHLTDGFHRVAAAERIARFTLPTKVFAGDHRKAILTAVGANSRHGLQRNRADMQRAVETLLRDPEWGVWTDERLAKIADVTPPTIAAARKRLIALKDATLKHLESGVRITADGRQMNTGNIGTRAKDYKQILYDWMETFPKPPHLVLVESGYYLLALRNELNLQRAYKLKPGNFNIKREQFVAVLMAREWLDVFRRDGVETTMLMLADLSEDMQFIASEAMTLLKANDVNTSPVAIQDTSIQTAYQPGQQLQCVYPCAVYYYDDDGTITQLEGKRVKQGVWAEFQRAFQRDKDMWTELRMNGGKIAIVPFGSFKSQEETDGKAVDSNGTPLELDHVVTSRLFSGEGIVISITGDAPTVSVKAADGTYSTTDWRKLTIIGKQHRLPSPAEPAAQNGSGAPDIQRITPQGMMFLEPGLHWRDRYNALKAQYAGDSKILLAATGTNYVVFGSDAPLINMTMNNIECIHSPLGWAAIFPCDRVGELSGFELIEYTELQFDRDDLKPPAAAVPVEINLGDLVETKAGTLGKALNFIGDAVEIATRNGVIKRNREFLTKRTYAVNDRVQHRDTGKLATVTARHNGQVYFEFDGEYSPVPCPEGEFDPVRTMERAQPVDEQQHIERVLDEQAAPHVDRDAPITLDAQSVAIATRINLHLCEVRDALRELAAHNPDLASEMAVSYLTLRQLALDVMDAGVKLDWSDVFGVEMEVAS